VDKKNIFFSINIALLILTSLVSAQRGGDIQVSPEGSGGTNLFAGTGCSGVWRKPLSDMISTAWQDSINVKDNSNISQSLKFGQSPLATDGIDAMLGEVPLPPAPFGFDARFHLPGGDESWADYRSTGKDTIKWVMKFQPGAGGYPITFSWDNSKLPQGSFNLKDIITGSIVNINMKTNSSYTLTNSGIASLQIVELVTRESQPTKPILISPLTNIINEPKNITFKWNKLSDVIIYYIQVSKDSTFATMTRNDYTITDTLKTITNLSEGQKYYWRVQAQNIIGFSPWSDTWKFNTIITAPSNLTLTRTGLKEITLKWNDNSNNEDGFLIERKQLPQTVYSFLDSLKTATVTFIDNNVEQGPIYYYRIKAYTKFTQSDYSNELSLEMTSVAEDKKIPTVYSLAQNYPNPFNPTTKIKFGLPESAFTRLMIYDLSGREVATLVNSELVAGYHEIEFNASNLSSGIYFYRITASNFTSVKKLILLK